MWGQAWKIGRASRLGVLAAVVALTIPTAAAEADTEADPIRLHVPVSEATVERYDKRQPADFASALLVAADEKNFEVHVRRAAYSDPITAEIVDGATHTQLPAAAINGFSGFAKAVHLHVTNGSGKTVADYDVDWCPNNGERARLNDNGPADPVYPYFCDGFNPWTKGSVWGVEAGWGASLSSYGSDFLLPPGGGSVPDGHYTVTAQWNPTVASALNITQSAVSVGVQVKTVGSSLSKTAAPNPRVSNSAHGITGPIRREQAVVTDTSDPSVETRPDLVAAPAWGMVTRHVGTKDYLAFGAMVWNAGPAPLVVEGFRQPDKAVMDAYEYFYGNGERVGRAKVGTMGYDTRAGHEHWHFKDFAKYDLLNRDKQHVLKSGKEAFCLANTDGVDLLVKNAHWRMGYDDLGSVCGRRNSVWIRETLSVGYGDTYGQFLPGQAFNITTVPNGTYFVRVTANPMNNLLEVSTDNNTSLRRIVLRGTKGNRRVNVATYQGIHTG